VHVPHVPHAGHIPHVGLKTAQAGPMVPWWNAFSVTVFLSWFGAAGYLLTRHGAFVAAVVLVFAVLCGLVGGWIVFLFLTRVLLKHERELTADETAVVGAVGHVSSAIRAGGTGEMVYEQMGARRSTPARAEDGTAIGRQEEVFVVRYEKGIAYVRRWEDGLGTRD
jgi:membrane protein implicated in regulation of membrane protease activity